MKKSTRIIWLALILVFAVIQLFPIEKTNPVFEPSNDFIAIENPPPKIAKLLKDACYDCHSYETKYPWYTNIQPVGWWVRGHYRGGRKHLNFSEWVQYNVTDKSRGLAEMAEEVEETKMPLMTYWLAHPEAKLSEADRAELVQYFKDKSS